MLDRCVNRLIELGRIDNAASSEITRVHAFNILKIVLLDTKQAKLLHKYFEVAVMTAVEAFASAKYVVRSSNTSGSGMGLTCPAGTCAMSDSFCSQH